MAKETEALEINKTWTVEDLPPNKKPINYKWVYRVKYNSDGTVERYKARLVIEGTNKLSDLTTMRLLLLFQKWSVYVAFSLLPLPRVGSSIKWMLTMPFYMVIWKKMCT